MDLDASASWQNIIKTNDLNKLFPPDAQLKLDSNGLKNRGYIELMIKKLKHSTSHGKFYNNLDL